MQRDLSIACALLLAGCTSDAQLVVDLVTDFAPVEEFASVRTERLGARGDVLATQTIAARADADYAGSGVRAAQLDVAPGEHTVRVSLLDDAGRVVIARSLRVQVEVATVVTALLSRRCLSVTCPGPDDDSNLTECAGGRCVEPGCSPETPSACPTPDCTVDADCAPTIACAVVRCREGACLSADEGACGEGRWCHPEDGCTDRMIVPDAGPPMGDGGACVPRTCLALGHECGAPIECGAPLDCGECEGTDTCGGGGAEYRCGSGDVTAPTVTFSSGPEDPTPSTSATFTFAADDGPGVGVELVECRLDEEAWVPCDGDDTLRGLDEGAHTFEVRARDRAGNLSEVAAWSWTIDHTPPVLVIDPIPGLAPGTYDATVNVSFTYTCSDALTGCVASSRACDVDGAGLTCGWLSGSFDAGASGPARFGDSTLTVEVSDEAGNRSVATRSVDVTRCAGDMQFPLRSSSGFDRGACCAGLVDSSGWVHASLGYWHPRGDGSCRPMSDYVAQNYETAWTGGGCLPGSRTTQEWGGGCADVYARYVCTTSVAQAQFYCGSDGGSGTQTPFHARASEGWHPPPSAGCVMGRMADTPLMRRYGAHDACWNEVDLAADRGSLATSDACKAGLTRFCRTNPVDASVGCVCARADPYASDGRR